jgi:cobalamin biosynthesis Mg chelatase CobN
MSSDIQETADGLSHHVRADRKTEVGEIGCAAQSPSSDRQGRGAETRRGEGKPKAKTLRAKAGAYGQSVSGILVALIAVLLVSLLFFSQSVVSFFSRKQHRETH